MVPRIIGVFFYYFIPRLGKTLFKFPCFDFLGTFHKYKLALLSQYTTALFGVAYTEGRFNPVLSRNRVKPARLRDTTRLNQQRRFYGLLAVPVWFCPDHKSVGFKGTIVNRARNDVFWRTVVPSICSGKKLSERTSSSRQMFCNPWCFRVVFAEQSI